MEKPAYASAPAIPGTSAASGTGTCSSTSRPIEESLARVIAQRWVNDEYCHLVVEPTARALEVQPGQFFNLLCPSPDEGELWLRRPQSIYRIDKPNGRLEFLYKVVGRGTRGLSTLKAGQDLNMVGPLGVGFKVDPAWKHVVVLGRGVGLATLGPISQMARANGIGVTAILSARTPDLAMGADLFSQAGEVIKVVDADGSSSVDNVRSILERLIAAGRADAFFTCGSNRLLAVMKDLGARHGIPGQAAMEQVMACGLGPCYICVRTFNVNGRQELKRVCVEGPVFDLQECL